MRAIAVALIATLATPGAARAQPRRDASAMSDEVRAHWERGLAEHAARRYEAASAAFEACYLLDPRREFLFAWAQAARLAGDCATATTLYRKYLQVAASARQADAAQTQITTCEAVLAARARATEPAAERSPATVEPQGAPTGAAPASESAPVSAPGPEPVEVRSRSPWYLDLWGDVLVGSGAAALTAGTLMYVSSGRTASSNAPTYDAYARRLASAEHTRTAAVVTLGAGSALVVAGVLHMVLRSDTREAPRTRVGVGVDGAQLGIHVQRAF